jgi:oxygen-independent coproporphyrinogen-3 oxidase
MNKRLLEKYNTPVPRYTSYPTVPYWDKAPAPAEWMQAVRSAFSMTNETEGISLYIHLPYCESLCTYCGCNTRITVNHQVEGPYIEGVLKEWKMYTAMMDRPPRLRELHLGGGTPTFFSPGNLRKLAEGVLKEACVPRDAEFSFEAHPLNTTTAHLAALAGLGFKRLSLGIQDFDPLVQRKVNRIQSYEQVQQVVKEARDCGYTSINFDLIYGLPFQRMASIEDTIARTITLRPDRIAFYSYAHVPQVKTVHRSFSEADLPTAEQKQEFYQRGCALLKEAGYVEIGMDHFALPSDPLFTAMRNGTLHRNFMGYTAHHTSLLIGLGVSAIGDSGTAFAQNHKVVEPYLEAVGRGVLPVVKGHVLDAEDLRIRGHILDLMCRQVTAMPGDAAIRERLNGLAADGLVVMERDRISIPPEAKPFLRNICSAFDLRLWRKTPAVPVFSKAI